jgi:TRAP-type mannitol/chloroaromatic compound transport system substrate-binding protein
MKEKGITALAWDEDELMRVRALAREIWDEFSQKSPMTKKVIDSQKQWLRELKLID